MRKINTCQDAVMDDQVGNEPLSGKAKLGYWCAAWIGVALVTLLINPSAIAAVPFFPAGLLGLLGNGEEGIIGFMTGAWVLGWVLYVVLTVSMVRTKTRDAFFSTYVVFCILLVLNVAGCQRLSTVASGIQ